MNIPQQHHQQQLMTTTTAPNCVYVAALGVYLPPLSQNLVQEESPIFLPMPSISSDPSLYSTSTHHRLTRPVSVGEFSMDDQRKLHLDRSQVRYFYEGTVQCTNLTEGMETFVAKDYFGEGETLGLVLRWITRMAMRGNSLKKTIHECDFVFWRGALTRLLSSCYDVGSHYDDIGVKVACEKYKGIYFIREFATEAKLQKEPTRNEYERKCCYAGLKFEQVYTSTKVGKKPRTQVPVNQNNEFIGMFKATLSPPQPSPQNDGTSEKKAPIFRLLYGAEIDCISKEGQYIELKTHTRHYGNGKGFPDKALKWWIQSFLVGIEKLIIGLHEDLILKRVQILPLDNLRDSFDSRVNTPYCFGFLYSFLETVKEYLDEHFEGTILLVERQPNSYEFKFRFILPGSAKAAEYRVLSEEFKAHGWK